ncbi:4897_t:CDS:2 [Ambispora leptoticha]|uniref:4897_t:CDS:1 n=1 Tax=Ambispora leptoticha TaxID=144679 RepID=A0A9N8ZTB7_9GLOM|nr:4897_t:CDS:2 [Ambispora leptoticha]
MNATTPYSSEFEIRKTAHNALLARYARNYPNLLSLSALPLVQRVHFLAPNQPFELMQQEDLEPYLQWQNDGVSDFLLHEWDPYSSTSVLQDAPIYYKRWDKETLHAMLEFGRKGIRKFVAILVWEEEKQEDIQYDEPQELRQEQTKEPEKLECKNWKYYNTKEVVNWESYLSEGWELLIDLADQAFQNKMSNMYSSDDKDVAAASSESNMQNNRALNDDDEESYWNQYGQPLGNNYSTFKTTSSKILTESLLEENRSSEDIHTSGKISNVDVKNSSCNDNRLEAVSNHNRVRFDKKENDEEEKHNESTIGTTLLTSFPPPNDDPAQDEGIQHQEIPQKETEKLMISTVSSITTDMSTLLSSSSVQKEVQNNEIQKFISGAIESIYGMARLNGVSTEKFLELAWDAVMKK